MKMNIKSTILLAVSIFVLASCATAGKAEDTADISSSQTQSPTKEAVTFEQSDDIRFLNGTIWECETQIGETAAWKCISIENGQAVYYTRMGKAIDTDPDTASIVLKGSIITFTQTNGSTHRGEIIGDTILLDGTDMYMKLP